MVWLERSALTSVRGYKSELTGLGEFANVLRSQLNPSFVIRPYRDIAAERVLRARQVED